MVVALPKRLADIGMSGLVRVVGTEEVEEKFDLYAEDDMNLAMQFPVSSNNTPGDADTDELFNDVVTDRVNYGVNDNNNGSFNGSAENDNVEESEGERGFVKGGPPLARKFNIYVGNLTWWTTDQQMEDVMKEIGVEDLIEIKFYENRSNGQSKGYCNVIVNSQNSITLIREKLPRREIHGKMPIVEVASKAALAQFESQAKTRPCPAPGAPVGCVPRNSIPGIPPYGMMPMGPRMNGPPIRPGRCGPPSPHGMSPPRNMLGMPHPHHPPPGHPSNFPHRPPMDLHRPPFRPHHQPMNMHCPVPNPGGMGHPGHHHPRPEWMRPPGAHHQYPCHPGLMQPNTGGPPMGSMGVTNAPPGVHGASSSSPLPHVNPAFFQPHHFSGPPPPGTMCGQGDNGSPISGLEARSRNNEAFPSPKKERNTFPTLNDEEVEEIMSRNRSVSSSAISRAVSDAATGDFASAIETLVTAISLIRQSKVASEDRCKVLLDSLKDTLGGIESKSYGRAREHARSRSRSRSREQNRHRSYYRSRSSRVVKEVS
ncbi:Cleavage and polyadenylation specificity factor subunit 6 [Orchesella cincta]|uniref:Cleavage and polyadenylation specificity factor subunit 6 n=1 Tax=Orchesella cincta TaxID=48709 RepID=A0A1D2NFI8_ORCCI|nr:Cleavage and polyadenylation specificity factor subunit 6 [Orchesella cincta]